MDPHGKDAHEPGAKLDKGKLRPALVLGGFAKALRAVTEVGTYGAYKYSEGGWKHVSDGLRRYDEAKCRHQMAEACGELTDQDTGFLHAAHEAWNALAKLELLIEHLDKNPLYMSESGEIRQEYWDGVLKDYAEGRRTFPTGPEKNLQEKVNRRIFKSPTS